jgi:hypothetical protein
MFKQISDLLNGGDNNICIELACVLELVKDICNEVAYVRKLAIYVMKLVIYVMN